MSLVTAARKSQGDRYKCAVSMCMCVWCIWQTCVLGGSRYSKMQILIDALGRAYVYATQ